MVLKLSPPATVMGCRVFLVIFPGMNLVFPSEKWWNILVSFPNVYLP